MGIEQFIQRICVQTAVYWGNPVPDGYGGTDYDDPVEIACRWDETINVITASNGKEVVSKASILVTQNIDEEGYLYLGTLDDLDSDALDEPETVDGAWKIQRFDKTPMIMKTDEFVRTAYL